MALFSNLSQNSRAQEGARATMQSMRSPAMGAWVMVLALVAWGICPSAANDSDQVNNFEFAPFAPEQLEGGGGSAINKWRAEARIAATCAPSMLTTHLIKTRCLGRADGFEDSIASPTVQTFECFIDDVKQPQGSNTFKVVSQSVSCGGQHPVTKTKAGPSFAISFGAYLKILPGCRLPRTARTRQSYQLSHLRYSKMLSIAPLNSIPLYNLKMLEFS